MNIPLSIDSMSEDCGGGFAGDASVAQGIERWFPVPKVAGSNPVGGTVKPRFDQYRYLVKAGFSLYLTSLLNRLYLNIHVIFFYSCKISDRFPHFIRGIIEVFHLGHGTHFGAHEDPDITTCSWFSCDSKSRHY